MKLIIDIINEDWDYTTKEIEVASFKEAQTIYVETNNKYKVECQKDALVLKNGKKVAKISANGKILEIKQ